MKKVARSLALIVISSLTLSMASFWACSEVPERAQQLITKLSNDYQQTTDPAYAYYIARLFAQFEHIDESTAWLKKLEQSNWRQGIERADFPRDNKVMNNILDRIDRKAPEVSLSDEFVQLRIPELFPESIAYDVKRKQFYIGSLKQNKIYIFDRQGKTKSLDLTSKDKLGSIYGIKFDDKRDLLWVVSNRISPEPTSQLLGININKRRIVFNANINNDSSGEFNDLCLLRDSVYLTDSRQHKVYQYSLKSETLTAVNFIADLQYPNGIACAQHSNQLFIAQLSGIIQVDLISKTHTQLKTESGWNLGGIDGLYFYQNQLFGIQNALGRASVIQISKLVEAQTSVEVLDNRHQSFDIPTTGVIINDKFYYIANSQLLKMNSDEPPSNITNILYIKL